MHWSREFGRSQNDNLSSQPPDFRRCTTASHSLIPRTPMSQAKAVPLKAESLKTEQPQRLQRRRQRWARYLTLAIALLGLAVIPMAKKRYFTCAICACARTTISALQVPITEEQTESECSRWYQDHVERSHEHLWVRGPYSEMYSLVGRRVSGHQISGDADGPVVYFSASSRLEMYRRCENPRVARDAFVQLASWEADGTPERQQQRTLERELSDWEQSLFTGPWPISAPSN